MLKLIARIFSYTFFEKILIEISPLTLKKNLVATFAMFNTTQRQKVFLSILLFLKLRPWATFKKILTTAKLFLTYWNTGKVQTLVLYIDS